jgi:hypothetical protein
MYHVSCPPPERLELGNPKVERMDDLVSFLKVVGRSNWPVT